MEKENQTSRNLATQAIHAGSRPDPLYGAISTPIYQTTSFAFADVGKSRGFDYSRTANPTRKVLEDTLLALEGGAGAVATASGMAALTTVVHLLGAGDHILCQKGVYGGTYRLFADVMPAFGIETSFVDVDDEKALAQAIRPSSKMLWVESMTNPLLEVADFEIALSFAKKKNLISVIDNTFTSPCFFRPLVLGFDVALHSTTKYINGHCDVIGGALVAREESLAQKLKYLANALGTTESAFDAWLVLRGMETLYWRMKAHEENALAAARFLEAHPQVKKVYYPGLPGHASHKRAKKYFSGAGGMVSFELRDQEAAHAFLRGLSLFAFAESLGGVASLAQHPFSMSHGAVPEEVKNRFGITPGLIRLSLGLEDARDLIEDLGGALSCAG